MHVQPNRQWMTDVYTAFNRREIDAVLAKMHPDVDWPNGMEGGRLRGHSQVRDYWERQWGRMDPHVEPWRIEEDESGYTVVDVHQVVRDLSGNILVDQMVQHVYSMHGGLIERMDIRKSPAKPTREAQPDPASIQIQEA